MSANIAKGKPVGRIEPITFAGQTPMSSYYPVNKDDEVIVKINKEIKSSAEKVTEHHSKINSIMVTISSLEEEILSKVDDKLTSVATTMERMTNEIIGFNSAIKINTNRLDEVSQDLTELYAETEQNRTRMEERIRAIERTVGNLETFRELDKQSAKDDQKKFQRSLTELSQDIARLEVKHNSVRKDLDRRGKVIDTRLDGLTDVVKESELGLNGMKGELAANHRSLLDQMGELKSRDSVTIRLVERDGTRLKAKLLDDLHDSSKRSKELAAGRDYDVEFPR